VRAERVDERGWFMLIFAGGKRTGLRLRYTPREFCGFEGEVIGDARAVEDVARRMLANDPSLGRAA
jgi:hypothetical protein